MNMMTALGFALDTWMAKRGGPQAIAARQQARLAALVAYARQHSRFYREKYEGLPDRITDPRRLPVVTKRELMSRFDDWVTDPAITRAGAEAFIADPALVGRDFLGKYGIWTTSGSTGSPAILIHDQRSLAVMSAVSLVHGARQIPDFREYLRRGHKVAGVYATGGHFVAYAMGTRQVLEHPSKAKSYKIFSVLDPMGELVRRLNEYQPALLGSYPTALRLLAEEQRAGRLQIAPLVITSGGEYLAPEVQSEIEAAFGARVSNFYACSETGVMGFACEHGWLHVAPDWMILEPVDEHYQPVASGQLSHSLLLTYLGNRVQPIIRYELGDRVLVSPEPCPCGNHLPALRVEGRTDEILTFRNAGGTPVRIMPLSFLAVIKQTPGVVRYQALQTGPARLEVRLETKAGADRLLVWATVQARLNAFLKAQGLMEPETVLADDLPRPDARSGKFRHVWSTVR